MLERRKLANKGFTHSRLQPLRRQEFPRMHDPGIDRLYEQWSGAFARKDIDAIMSLMTDDYSLWIPGADPIGRDALRGRLAGALAAYDLTPSFELLDRVASGDLACDIGWDVQEARPHAGSGAPAMSQRQRVCLLLRRGPDGVWQFARGMSQPAPPAKS